MKHGIVQHQRAPRMYKRQGDNIFFFQLTFVHVSMNEIKETEIKITTSIHFLHDTFASDISFKKNIEILMKFSINSKTRIFFF